MTLFLPRCFFSGAECLRLWVRAPMFVIVLSWLYGCEFVRALSAVGETEKESRRKLHLLSLCSIKLHDECWEWGFWECSWGFVDICEFDPTKSIFCGVFFLLIVRDEKETQFFSFTWSRNENFVIFIASSLTLTIFF